MPRPPDAPPSNAPGRVLIVDDSRLVRAMIAGYLHAAGYLVDEAPDGASALAMLGAHSHDVVVTDLNMPGIDGFQVLSETRRIAPGVEVIILTGAHASNVEAAVRALRLGAHDYLTKPPGSPEEVVLTVERAIEKQQLRATNRRLLEQLEALSLTDALTGVPNRRSYEAALEREIARAQRHRHALSLALLDIDHFKRVNDTYGHPDGDAVLQSFARTVTGALRRGDSLYRYGGEEFVVLLPHADGAGAGIAARRIIAAVAAAPITLATTTLPITASAGVACLDLARGDGLALVGRADAALYEAKRGGRNRVCVDGSV
jgi:two-component system, cell cycle response regulator